VVKKALISNILYLIVALPVHAQEVANNCEEFSQLILKKYAVIEESIAVNDGKLTADQSVQVRELLRSACSPQFSPCGFSICKTENSPTLPNIVKEIPTEALIPETPVDGISSKPLGWVTDNMSCEDFLGQLRSRFQPGNLDEGKRKELKSALELACGAKFKRCNFEACTKVNK
jgi:hypothetical protein